MLLYIVLTRPAKVSCIIDGHGVCILINFLKTLIVTGFATRALYVQLQILKY